MDTYAAADLHQRLVAGCFFASIASHLPHHLALFLVLPDEHFVVYPSLSDKIPVSKSNGSSRLDPVTCTWPRESGHTVKVEIASPGSPGLEIGDGSSGKPARAVIIMTGFPRVALKSVSQACWKVEEEEVSVATSASVGRTRSWTSCPF